MVFRRRRISVQVSGIGDAKYCWDVDLLLVVVLVLVLVLDPIGNGLHQLFFFDYENEDDDEDDKQSTRHLPRMFLLPNGLAGATFSERSLGKSLVPIY